MMAALVGWRGYAAAAAIAALIAGAGAWTAQQWRWDARMARVERDQAEYRDQQAKATIAAVEAARDEEQRRTAAVERERNDAQQRAAAAAADADAATVASRRLRQRIDALVADAVARNSAVADGGPSAGAPIDMLAHVLGQAIDTAGELAEYADRARNAGLTCERAYDAVRAATP
ncbi:DUF2514 family protein [Bordetella ansorpii]|uniref:DUF2514 family protein n=1 Tax=Bordetella ansorpii TaxID=288768 RepID=UPI0013901774|nr:DUF2514 family protein [Bordetella ansorpii]